MFDPFPTLRAWLPVAQAWLRRNVWGVVGVAVLALVVAWGLA